MSRERYELLAGQTAKFTRNKQRLIEICWSVNSHVVGLRASRLLARGATVINKKNHLPNGKLRKELQLLRLQHDSIHVAELAHELLQYKPPRNHK